MDSLSGAKNKFWKMLVSLSLEHLVSKNNYRAAGRQHSEHSGG